MTVIIRDALGRKIEGTVTITHRDCTVTMHTHLTTDEIEVIVWFPEGGPHVQLHSFDEAMEEVDRWHRTKYEA